MSEVEFLDDPEVPERAEGAGTREGDAVPAGTPGGGTSEHAPDGRRRVPAVAGPVLAAGAAALLVAGAWRDTYSITLGTSTAPRSFAVDGWGRLRDSVAATGGQHTTRLAIATCLAAALVVAGAVLRLLRRRGAAGRVGTGLVLVGAGAAAAVAGAALLDGLATVDNYRAALRVESQDPSFRTLDVAGPALHVGAFVWLSAAGAVVAVLASVVPGLPLGRRQSTRTGDPSSQASTSSTASE